MTATTHGLDESSPTTTRSASLPTVESIALHTETRHGVVIYADFSPVPETADLPASHLDIDDVFARFEQDPARAAALEEARRTIASRHYGGSGGLAALRLRKGWSQRRLAEAIGVKQPHIARLESGQNEPSLGTVRKLSAALDVTVEEIVNAFDGQD